MGKAELSDTQVLEQAQAARERERTARARECRAESAVYDARHNQVVVRLTNGVSLSFPRDMLPEISSASAGQLADVEVNPSGEGLHWDSLDADYRVPDLVLAVLGPRKIAMRELARAGGRAKSVRKVRASRRNGAKGGRPRKV